MFALRSLWIVSVELQPTDHLFDLHIIYSKRFPSVEARVRRLLATNNMSPSSATAQPLPSNPPMPTTAQDPGVTVIDSSPCPSPSFSQDVSQNGNLAPLPSITDANEKQRMAIMTRAEDKQQGGVEERGGGGCENSISPSSPSSPYDPELLKCILSMHLSHLYGQDIQARCAVHRPAANLASASSKNTNPKMSYVGPAMEKKKHHTGATTHTRNIIHPIDALSVQASQEAYGYWTELAMDGEGCPSSSVNSAAPSGVNSILGATTTSVSHSGGLGGNDVLNSTSSANSQQLHIAGGAVETFVPTNTPSSSFGKNSSTSRPKNHNKQKSEKIDDDDGFEDSAERAERQDLDEVEEGLPTSLHPSPQSTTSSSSSSSAWLGPFILRQRRNNGGDVNHLPSNIIPEVDGLSSSSTTADSPAEEGGDNNPNGVLFDVMGHPRDAHGFIADPQNVAKVCGDNNSNEYELFASSSTSATTASKQISYTFVIALPFFQDCYVPKQLLTASSASSSTTVFQHDGDRGMLLGGDLERKRDSSLFLPKMRCSVCLPFDSYVSLNMIETNLSMTACHQMLQDVLLPFLEDVCVQMMGFPPSLSLQSTAVNNFATKSNAKSNLINSRLIKRPLIPYTTWLRALHLFTDLQMPFGSVSTVSPHIFSTFISSLPMGGGKWMASVGSSEYPGNNANHNNSPLLLFDSPVSEFIVKVHEMTSYNTMSNEAWLGNTAEATALHHSPSGGSSAIKTGRSSSSNLALEGGGLGEGGRGGVDQKDTASPSPPKHQLEMLSIDDSSIVSMRERGGDSSKSSAQETTRKASSSQKQRRGVSGSPPVFDVQLVENVSAQLYGRRDTLDTVNAVGEIWGVLDLEIFGKEVERYKLNVAAFEKSASSTSASPQQMKGAKSSQPPPEVFFKNNTFRFVLVGFDESTMDSLVLHDSVSETLQRCVDSSPNRGKRLTFSIASSLGRSNPAVTQAVEAVQMHTKTIPVPISTNEGPTLESTTKVGRESMPLVQTERPSGANAFQYDLPSGKGSTITLPRFQTSAATNEVTPARRRSNSVTGADSIGPRVNSSGKKLFSPSPDKVDTTTITTPSTSVKNVSVVFAQFIQANIPRAHPGFDTLTIHPFPIVSFPTCANRMRKEIQASNGMKLCTPALPKPFEAVLHVYPVPSSLTGGLLDPYIAQRPENIIVRVECRIVLNLKRMTAMVNGSTTNTSSSPATGSNNPGASEFLPHADFHNLSVTIQFHGGTQILSNSFDISASGPHFCFGGSGNTTTMHAGKVEQISPNTLLWTIVATTPSSWNQCTQLLKGQGSNTNFAANSKELQNAGLNSSDGLFNVKNETEWNLVGFVGLSLSDSMVDAAAATLAQCYGSGGLSMNSTPGATGMFEGLSSAGGTTTHPSVLANSQLQSIAMPIGGVCKGCQGYNAKVTFVETMDAGTVPMMALVDQMDTSCLPRSASTSASSTTTRATMTRFAPIPLCCANINFAFFTPKSLLTHPMYLLETESFAEATAMADGSENYLGAGKVISNCFIRPSILVCSQCDETNDGEDGLDPYVLSFNTRNENADGRSRYSCGQVGMKQKLVNIHSTTLPSSSSSSSSSYLSTLSNFSEQQFKKLTKEEIDTPQVNGRKKSMYTVWNALNHNNVHSPLNI